MVCQRRWKEILYYIQVGVPRRWGFLSEGFEIAQQAWPPENSPSRKRPPCWHPCQFFIHVQRSPPNDYWPKCKPPPDKSVALGQSNFRIPLVFMTGGLLCRSVKLPLVFASPTGYMFTSSLRFSFIELGYSINSSKMIGNFPAVSNFNRFILSSCSCSYFYLILSYFWYKVDMSTPKHRR